MATTQAGPPSEVEIIKNKSNYLRGTIVPALKNGLTGAFPADDTQLTKFHGFYQQDDRDIRLRRQHRKLEPAYCFMIRVGIPGGICTPEQWQVMDELSCKYANQTLKLTTRQAFQLHGVVKRNMWQTMHAINEALMTSLAACGDVVRNTMGTPVPLQSKVHEQVQEVTRHVGAFTKPKTKAYHEIWVDKMKVLESEDSRQPEEIEPLYGKIYLPRKFKIGFTIPPQNDIDVFSQDLGFIAIADENEKLLGFNITCGGGMGMTHGVVETYPRVGTIIGFCTPEQVEAVTTHIIGIQRDFGDRSNRKHARFKYTIDDRGVDWLKTELNSRLGWELEPARDYTFTGNGDAYGWSEAVDGSWCLGLFVEHGRVRDTDDATMKKALREIADLKICDFRLTGNQGLALGSIATKDKARIDEILAKHGVAEAQGTSGMRLTSMACAALPYCALAMAESERYLPTLVSRLEPILKKLDLWDEKIVTRMTGCPNGCGRAALGEIGFVGKSIGHYNVYLGASHTGDRLNKLYKEGLTEDEIVAELEPILTRYAAERNDGEKFGDFVIRAGYVKATLEGKDFHD